jgi:hypothetical protein
MAKVTFTVHTVGEVVQQIETTHNGEPVAAKIAVLEVELISDHHGVVTLRFSGKERAEVEESLTPGSKHTWTI